MRELGRNRIPAAVVTEDDDGEPPLEQLLERVEPADLVLIEGYKRGGHDKIEVRRGAKEAPLLAAADPTVVAIASDRQVPEAASLGRPVPVFRIDDVAAIASFVVSHCGAGDGVDPERIRGAA